MKLKNMLKKKEEVVTTEINEFDRERIVILKKMAGKLIGHGSNHVRNLGVMMNELVNGMIAYNNTIERMGTEEALERKKGLIKKYKGILAGVNKFLAGDKEYNTGNALMDIGMIGSISMFVIKAFESIAHFEVMRDRFIFGGAIASVITQLVGYFKTHTGMKKTNIGYEETLAALRELSKKEELIRDAKERESRGVKYGSSMSLPKSDMEYIKKRRKISRKSQGLLG